MIEIGIPKEKRWGKIEIPKEKSLQALAVMTCTVLTCIWPYLAYDQISELNNLWLLHLLPHLPHLQMTASHLFNCKLLFVLNKGFLRKPYGILFFNTKLIPKTALKETNKKASNANANANAMQPKLLSKEEYESVSKGTAQQKV